MANNTAGVLVESRAFIQEIVSMNDHLFLSDQHDRIGRRFKTVGQVFGFLEIQPHLVVDASQAGHGNSQPVARQGTVDVSKEKMPDSPAMGSYRPGESLLSNKPDAIQGGVTDVKGGMMHKQEQAAFP